MDKKEYRVRFCDQESSEGERFATELCLDVEDQAPKAQVSRQAERPDAQDFGSTVILILGTEAAIALAKGIAQWLARRPAATIEIERPDGTKVRFAGGTVDAAKIAKEVFRGS